MKKIFLLLLITLRTFSQEDTIKLKEIEVNANRVSSLYKDELRIIQIIDQKDLKQLPVKSLADILDYYCGIDVRQRGPNGVQSDVSIRGSNYEQVLIMINGIPVNDPQTGHHNFNIPININVIDRIEILSGSDARRYGANAFAGAINFVTKTNEPKKLIGSLSGGDYKYLEAQLTTNIKLLQTNQLISLNHNRSNGYRENTDFNNSHIFWQISKEKENNNTLAMFAFENKAFGANSFYTPKFPYQFEQTRSFLTNLTNKYYWKNNNTWTVQAYYRQHHDRFELFRENYKDIIAPSWYKNHNYHMTQVFGSQTNTSLNSKLGKTTLGIDYKYEKIFSNVLGEPMNDTIKAPFEKNGKFTKKANKTYYSIFIDHYINLKKIILSTGLMSTYLSTNNLYFYPGIDIGYKAFNDKINLYTSINRSLRLPTYTELYYKDAAHEANNLLKPEEAWNYETGFKFKYEKIFFQLALFYREAKNVIDWVRIAPTDKWQTANITNVNTSGIDVNIVYFNNADSYINKVILSYTYCSINKLSENYYSKYSLDILKNKLAISINHKVVKQIKATWTAIYQERQGTYTEYPSGLEKTYKPFITVDGKISYNFNNLEIYINGTNLFDTYYYDIANIPMPGRWVKGGICFSF
jgi:iron complex outermembrane receptor protein